ncbi:MAG: YHS domain-containing protein [Gemmataceae bacterium]
MTRLALVVALGLLSARAGADPSRKSAREALQGFHDLIGSWKGSGTPQQGTREQRDRGFWQEAITWQWQFKDKDAWLRKPTSRRGSITGSSAHSPREGCLRVEGDHRGEGDTDVHRQARRQEADRRADRRDGEAGAAAGVLAAALQPAPVLPRGEAGGGVVHAGLPGGATKQEFASVDKGPECIVPGGLGTIPVAYKGKTYYVCCTGCRDAFREEPEKYIKEFEEAKKAKK